jgi:protein-S-isoprenylcysteine O-methyltransferase Ste14
VRHALESIVMLMRHLTAILVLPCAMAIFIPIWIARRGHVVYTTPHSPAGMLGVAAGIVSMAIGLALFAASLFYFWSRGRGTLAPWDPPRRFVVEGPYRFVRNPMISGVRRTVRRIQTCRPSIPAAVTAWTAEESKRRL